jgi:hypothetical protein
MGFGDAGRWIHKWVLDEEASRRLSKKRLNWASISLTPPMWKRHTFCTGLLVINNE